MPKDNSDFCVCSSSLGAVKLGETVDIPLSDTWSTFFGVFFLRWPKNSYTNFLDSTYKQYHMILVFLCLTYFSPVWQPLDLCTSLKMTQLHSFLWLSSIPIVCMDHSFFILSFVDGHIDFSHGYCWRRHHSSSLPWRIPWTEEPGGLYSPWGHKELDMTEQLTHAWLL